MNTLLNYPGAKWGMATQIVSLMPPLRSTEIVTEHTPYVNGGYKDAHGNYLKFQGRKERYAKTRSKTFPGIARAMAEQWAGKADLEEK